MLIRSIVLVYQRLTKTIAVKSHKDLDAILNMKAMSMKMPLVLTWVLICLSLYSNLSLASSSENTNMISSPTNESPVCSTDSECSKYSQGGALRKKLYRFGYYQKYISQDLAAQACAHLNKRLPTIRELALQAMKKTNNRINKNYPAVAIVEIKDFESGDPTKIPYGFKREDFELIIGLVPTHLPTNNDDELNVKIDGFYYANTNYKKLNTYLSYFTETSWIGWLNSQSTLDTRWPLQYNNVKDVYAFSTASGNIWWTSAQVEITTMYTGAFTCVKSPTEERSTNWRAFP